jgi:hypothetical protein
MEAIRRTPNTMGHTDDIMSTRMVGDALLLSWEIRNFYFDHTIRVALRGVCRVTTDGKTLKGVEVSQ